MDEIKKIKSTINNLRKYREEIEGWLSYEYVEDALCDLQFHLRRIQDNVTAAEQFDDVTELAQERIAREMKEVERIRKTVYIKAGVLI